MSGDRRTNIDASSLLGDDSSASYSDARDLERTSSSSHSEGSLATLKSWWADPTRRRYLIGILLGVVTFLIIVAVVAIITKEEIKSSGGGDDVAASSTASPPPMPPSSTAAPPIPPFNPETPWLFPRLPNSTSASNYALSLTFDVDQYRFNGSEVVTLQTTRPLDHLLLHSVNLNWSSISLTTDQGDNIPVIAWQYQAYLVLNLSSIIPPQTAAKLSIAFQGFLVRGAQSGTYPGWNIDADGRERLMVATQFESMSARRAFPCLDEPALKSTFDIDITNAPQYPTVLSNQEAIDQKAGPNGWLTTRYETTPIMSTYLVAWVVTDYVPETRTTQCKGKDIRTSVWVPRELKNSSIVPAFLGAHQIAFFCDYFDMDYPMKKEDHVYIPQFAAGAMENWGLITYRDNAILWDPALNTIVQLQRVAFVMAHELAHQWFGNIVTAAWWSQLWLNEGFARYMQFLAGDDVSPELQLTEQFITVAQRQAMLTDSSPRTNPIVTDNGSGLSDITYAKGASVLRMIVGLITEPVFHAGIKAFLRQFQYSSAYTIDLFTILDAAVKQAGGSANVTEIMWEWTSVSGYPLVSCDSATQADGSCVWTCTQQRFYSYDEPNPANSTWTIPLTLTTPTPIPASVNLVWPKDQRTFTFTLPTTPAWVKLNTNTTGFYRVQYSPSQWAALVHALNRPGFSDLHHDDRVGLVNDAFALLDKGLLGPVHVMNISLFLQYDTSFVTWTIAAPSLLSLWDRVKYQLGDGREAMSMYMQQLMGSVALKMNISRTNTIADEVLENLLASAIARFDLGRRTQLLRMYEQLERGEVRVREIPANLVDLVLQVGVAASTESVFSSWVYARYAAKMRANETDPDDPYAVLGFPSLLTALTQTQQLDSLRTLFERAADPRYFRPQDAATVITGAAANDYGLVVFNDFLNSTQWFSTWNATLSQPAWGQVLQSTLALHSWPSIIDSLDSFLAAQPVTAFIRGRIAAGLATARANSRWIDMHWPTMTSYLTSGQWRRPTLSGL